MSELLIGEVTPGYYKMRRTKGGIDAPVRIFRPCQCTVRGDREHDWDERCDRFPPLRALVDGDQWLKPLPIWTHCHPIDRADYEFMVADHAWCRDNAPDLPEANPFKPVDLAKMPSVF